MASGRADRTSEPAPRLRVGVDVVVLSLAPAVEPDGSGDVPAGGSERGQSTDPAPLVPQVYLWREPDGLDRLPGVSLQPAESPEQAARRVLATIGIDRPRHLEQLASFGDPARVPGVRTLSVSYLALLPEPSPVVPDGHDGRWRPLQPADTGPERTAPGDDAEPRGGHETVRFTWDHSDILAAGVRRVRGKLSYSTIAYGLLPDEFTMSELQDVYEAVLGVPLDKRNFRRRIAALDLLADTGRLRRGPHRPARLHTFTDAAVVLLDDVITTPSV